MFCDSKDFEIFANLCKDPQRLAKKCRVRCRNGSRKDAKVVFPVWGYKYYIPPDRTVQSLLLLDPINGFLCYVFAQLCYVFARSLLRMLFDVTEEKLNFI